MSKDAMASARKHNMQIIIKINKVKFVVDVNRDKKSIVYGLDRNDKCLLVFHYPINKLDEIKMNIYRDLSEAISYEIIHEIQKLSLTK